ncbi:MAG TPA: trypsin-like peptidase domain-containing protein [Methylomirabilota bacterium]|jgi:serine protease Do|nr:trypsin-like peptidase domain-containing protein [Methylomirabilota bacterium]
MSRLRPKLLALIVAMALLAPAGAARAQEAKPADALAPETKYWREDTAVSPPAELTRFNQLLADLSDQLKPALVYVSVRRTPGRDREDEGPGEPRRSSGSGFIIDPGGLIVTNAHVVEDADWIQIRLADGRRFPGKVMGRDTRADLALIKLDGVSNLPTLPLGDSNRVRVGEFVLALGHPFGLEQTVSFGIVSRKGSSLGASLPGVDYIQTDASINPGNSGGPLVNMAGQVVGVNSMAARNGSIGFAIPSSLVKMLVPPLVANGKMEWGFLGVSITEVGEDDLGRLKLREAKGVLVRGVIPGEPAERGGMQPDDVIIGIDGLPVSEPRELQRAVSTSPVGKRVRVVVLRAGEQKEIDITIGRWEERPERTERAPR